MAAKRRKNDDRHPALALLELRSIARGIQVADLMVKRAPIALLKVGTVHPGHYLILIGGTVASVEEAFQAGRAAADDDLLDEVFLPDVAPEVHDAALGAHLAAERGALGVLETTHVASLLRAADAGIKGAEVRITEIRMADDLGGQAFVLFDGEVADVEAALEIGQQAVDAIRVKRATVMPRLDDTLREALAAGSRFAACVPLEPRDAELTEPLGEGR